MAEKAQVSRTFAPIHFEDLDPHRFEDLVRELIYEFKDWQSIEATGRSGSDEGFDVRAFEKQREQTPLLEEDDQEVNRVGNPMEGNLWMVQCKREKEIGPTKVAEIIDQGVDRNSPPYGYILAASVNFSKKSYDIFRSKLRGLGVMEFYLWGKAELEDMLHMPKNDRLLFTYFGISLVTRRRSRATEIRSVIANKNKLYSVVSESINQKFNTQILVRDIKDTKYPYPEGYPDFKTNPRWREYCAFQYHPWGLCVHDREFFAYLDPITKQWDYVPVLDLAYRQVNETGSETLELRQAIEDYWEHLPRRNKAKFRVDGLIKFDDIIAIDAKGDSFFEFPHLFVDFRPKEGPFHLFHKYFVTEERQEFDLEESGFKKTKIFPKKFPEPKVGNIYKEKAVEFDPQSLSMLNRGSEQVNLFYDCGGKYEFLNQRDVIQVKDSEDSYGPKFIQITHKYKIRADQYLAANDTQYDDYCKRTIELQIGRALAQDDFLTVFEFKRAYLRLSREAEMS